MTSHVRSALWTLMIRVITKSKEVGYFFKYFELLKYRGSLPNAKFGSGKKSHLPNFASAKFLANGIFGYLLYYCVFWPKDCINEMNCGGTMHYLNISGMFWENPRK